MKLFIFLLFLSSFISAQDNTWRYISSHELPMLRSVKQSVDGSIYMIHGKREIYKLDGTMLVKMDSLPVPVDDLGQELYDFDFSKNLTIISDGEYHLNYWASFYTEDNGETYLSDVEDEIYFLSSVRFVNTEISYGIKNKPNNTDYFLVKSMNSGLDCQEIFNSEKNINFAIFNADSLIIYTEHSIFFSGNGGESWEKRVEFNDTRNYEIFTAGKKVLLTWNSSLFESDDFGVSFQLKKEFPLSSNVTIQGPISLSIYDEKTWAIAKDEKLYYTNDRGLSWIYFEEEDDLYCSSFGDIYFVDSTLLFFSDNPYKLLSLDEDEIFRPNENMGKGIKGFYALHDSLFVIIYDNYCDLTAPLTISIDHGYTWHHQYTFDLLSKENLISIDFSTKNVGYFITDSSVFKGVYPFDSWELVSYTYNGYNSHVVFVNELEGIIYSGTNAKYTNNGGASFIDIFDLDEVNYFESLKDSINQSFWLIGETISDKTIAFIYIENGEIVYEYSSEISSVNYNGSLSYNGRIYINSKDGVFILKKYDEELESFCSVGENEIVAVISEDSIIVFDRSFNTNNMFLVSNDCNIEAQLFFPYTDVVRYGGNADFYFASSQEGFMITSIGKMLKLTNNFREDLLVSTKEEPIADIKKESLYLFPNPAYDRVFISKAVSDPRIVLYDMNGRVMEQSESQEMEIGDVGMGMYFYVIMDGGEYVGSGKFVVVR